MPTIMVTLKEGSDAKELENAKKAVEEQGGKITHESKLYKGFNAEFPSDKISTLQSNPHVDVETDQEVKTQ